MDCIKSHHPSTESTRSKFAKTLSKCINNPQTPSRFAPNHNHDNGPPSKQLRTLSQELNMSIKKLKSNQPKLTKQRSQRSNSDEQQAEKSKAAKEAFIAKLFASLSSIKAAYAEIQCAQFPYNSVAIQSADEALVRELTVLSELKHKYLNNVYDLPPSHVTQLLAEIQEQQSNIKTYEITIKQLESKVLIKNTEITSLMSKLDELTKENKSLEKRLNSSGIISPLLGDDITLSSLNQCHFIRVLHYASRSVRHFVKHLVREMQAKNWDLDLAAKTIEPNTVFGKPKHKILAVESYFTQVMFDGFNHHGFFLPNEGAKQPPRTHFFENFQKLQSLTTTQIISQYPECPFAKFCKGKYLKLVHPKIECSLFGNLDQRKAISAGAFPGTEFISLFSEMARRVWVLHCLAFSFEPPALAFQVKRGSRFSEVYMESACAAEDEDSATGDGEFTVGFTVIPGFKIGKMVVQSQVYLSPLGV